jgi:hypothetical protein
VDEEKVIETTGGATEIAIAVAGTAATPIRATMLAYNSWRGRRLIGLLLGGGDDRSGETAAGTCADLGAALMQMYHQQLPQ